LAENIASQIGYRYEEAELLDISVRKKLGGQIIQKNFWLSEDAGSIEIRSKGDFIVYLPDDATPARRRFTIAHELGHYVLHYLWPIHKGDLVAQPTWASRYGSEQTEWEANWFAAAFLMPAAPFKSAWQTARSNKATVVADVFGVSRRAAEVRAKALGEIR
jgi:Zn-dependent peptidase ImmA (M78 family)